MTKTETSQASRIEKAVVDAVNRVAKTTHTEKALLLLGAGFLEAFIMSELIELSAQYPNVITPAIVIALLPTLLGIDLLSIGHGAAAIIEANKAERL